MREIDDALLSGAATQTELCAKYRFDKSSLSRHYTKHLSRSIANRIPPERAEMMRKAREAEKAAIVYESEVDEVAVKKREAEELGMIARRENSLAIALRALDTWANLHKLQQLVIGKITGDTYVTNNIVVFAEQATGLLQQIVAALKPFPEARLAVADLIRTVGGDSCPHAGHKPHTQAIDITPVSEDGK